MCLFSMCFALEIRSVENRPKQPGNLISRSRSGNAEKNAIGLFTFLYYVLRSSLFEVGPAPKKFHSHFLESIQNFKKSNFH